jgi:hypothetical protein
MIDYISRIVIVTAVKNWNFFCFKKYLPALLLGIVFIGNGSWYHKNFLNISIKINDFSN